MRAICEVTHFNFVSHSTKFKDRTDKRTKRERERERDDGDEKEVK